MKTLIIAPIVLVIIFAFFVWSLCIAAARGDRNAKEVIKELKGHKAAKN